MFKTLGIVEVPSLDSPSFYSGQRVFCRKFGGNSLLEWVTRRLTDAMLLEQVIVLVADEALAGEAADHVPADVPVYMAGRQHDQLGQLADVLRYYSADAAVCVGVDHPFLDPVLIDRLVAHAESYSSCDYVSYCSSRKKSVLQARLGLLAQWYRASAVYRADAMATEGSERSDVARFIHGRPESFQMRLVPAPAELDRDDVRLALDSAEDWEHAQLILDALGPENLDWQRIASLLEEHPDLRERMASLNQEAGDI